MLRMTNDELYVYMHAQSISYSILV